MTEIFDPWPEKYDAWFQTPIGRLIKGYEVELILSLLKPGRREFILDPGFPPLTGNPGFHILNRTSAGVSTGKVLLH